MNQPAAFKATVHGIRTVPSRKVLQIVVETAIEELPHVAQIAEHGVWLAIARLAPEGAAPATSGQEREAPSGTTPPAPLKTCEIFDRSERRQWVELAPSQQSAIRCRDPIFRAFLETEFPVSAPFNNESDAASIVRNICKVGSRGEIIRDEPSGELWDNLERRFQTWRVADKIGALA